MARVTITNPATRHAENQLGSFVQWDGIDESELSTCATHARNLGKRLGKPDAGIFAAMADGETRYICGLEYFREG